MNDAALSGSSARSRRTGISSSLENRPVSSGHSLALRVHAACARLCSVGVLVHVHIAAGGRYIDPRVPKNPQRGRSRSVGMQMPRPFAVLIDMRSSLLRRTSRRVHVRVRVHQTDPASCGVLCAWTFCDATEW
jgi:hypothetical protein